MKDLIGEYGYSIYYGIISLLCIIMFIFTCRTVVTNVPSPYKTVTYNSDSYSKADAPIITLKKNTLIIDKNSLGYSTADEILASLKANDIYSISTNATVKVRGKINVSKEGNYNIDIVASNKYATSTAGVTISVLDSNNTY